MRTIKQCCRWAVLVSICLVLMLYCSCAYADETVEVHIPVMATGADCSVELLDEQYHRVQWLDLQRDVSSYFTVTCNGLKRFTFKAVVVNQDDEGAKYDRTVYTIHVDTFLTGQGEMTYFVSIENPDDPAGKLGLVRFDNIPKYIEPAPTPTPTPAPLPTATPKPYDYVFTFTKRWSGGHEDSIDWAMYNADGTQRHKLFNKRLISEKEWYYEAYFTEDVADCYVIETPVEGYMVIYQNVGEYSDVTDRCYPGGTIINYKAPQTGDGFGLSMNAVLFAIAVVLLGIRWIRRAVRKA